ncbi:hypothetical protein [Asticcacaulis sp. EMRT-3]|uniref:hypothetical protein n=1 Tax=Asticcacaulis sp. EMRT-3 TaxID=3040349 RepID=UPI0024AF13AD|nr:hypothetical protein [Asticcacaulis sp. EMRT-3]MDI7775370.1 hypothetical protein [Asticcacaulis sp. EMRT-3]
MASIAVSRMTLLKGLINTLPPAPLRSLEMALGMTNDALLIEVRALVTAEIETRHLRDSVFLPFTPMFEARADGLDAMRFPRWLLYRLWSWLEQNQAPLCTEAAQALRVLRTEDPTPVVFFRLVKAAADICREAPQDIAPVNGAETDMVTVGEFAAYLDLHRLMRQTLARLPEFLGRMDAEKAAALRVMFGDASALDPASGYRFLELIFANLEDGAQIIKFVATVSDRPKDRFLAESEMAIFGERILDQIEARIGVLKHDMEDRHGDNLDKAAEQVAQGFGQLQAFEHYIELSRDGLWGKRVMAARQHLAALVEQPLNGAEKLLEQALIMKNERRNGRIKREVPDLERLPDAVLEARIRQTLGFIGKARPIANMGGFLTLHTKVAQALEAYMDAWFAELLSLANSDEPADMVLVMRGFDLVTDLMALSCGDEKAQTARRRVASCERLKPARSVA